jgi:hypothetical protein
LFIFGLPPAILPFRFNFFAASAQSPGDAEGQHHLHLWRVLPLATAPSSITSINLQSFFLPLNLKPQPENIFFKPGE